MSRARELLSWSVLAAVVLTIATWSAIVLGFLLIREAVAQIRDKVRRRTDT